MRTFFVSFILFTTLFFQMSAVHSQTLKDDLAWLEKASAQNVRAARRTMNDGTAAYPPQVGIGYNAFWLRDYAYVLEGCADVIPEKELLAAANLFVNAVSSDGAGVDCVKYDGTPIYKPGYGSMGENPVADGSQFTVAVVYLTWKQTGSDTLLEPRILDRLIQTLRVVPTNPRTGLVFISDKTPWDRCPYGFTDTIRKRGDVFFSSLLQFEAAARLAEMLEAAGRPDEAKEFRVLAENVRAKINEVFWDETLGLYRAATIRCAQGDVWGSAFAVYLGVADEKTSRKIAETFQKNYDGIVQNGQIRHLLPGEYWEAGCARDTYQNGAFWGTPTGWMVYTLDKIDPDLARRTVRDMVRYYQQNGIPEWSFRGKNQMTGYLSSSTLPLSGIRKIVNNRK